VFVCSFTEVKKINKRKKTKEVSVVINFSTNFFWDDKKILKLVCWIFSLFSNLQSKEFLKFTFYSACLHNVDVKSILHMSYIGTVFLQCEFAYV